MGKKERNPNIEVRRMCVYAAVGVWNRFPPKHENTSGT